MTIRRRRETLHPPAHPHLTARRMKESPDLRIRIRTKRRGKLVAQVVQAAALVILVPVVAAVGPDPETRRKIQRKRSPLVKKNQTKRMTLKRRIRRKVLQQRNLTKNVSHLLHQLRKGLLLPRRGRRSLSPLPPARKGPHQSLGHAKERRRVLQGLLHVEKRRQVPQLVAVGGQEPPNQQRFTLAGSPETCSRSTWMKSSLPLGR